MMGFNLNFIENQKMKKIVLVVITAFMTTTIGLSSAMAAEEGGYGLLSIGFSPLTDPTGTMSGYGVEVGGGYNFNKYFGTEAIIGALGLSAGSAYNPLSFSISVAGHLPLTDGFGIYGKVGEAETMVTLNSTNGGASQGYSGVTGLYGVGVEFYTADHADFRIGYDHYDLSVIPGWTMSTNYINITRTAYF
jgi:outer membrane immunogenic protein